jgi:hypothetical protein
MNDLLPRVTSRVDCLFGYVNSISHIEQSLIIPNFRLVHHEMATHVRLNGTIVSLRTCPATTAFGRRHHGSRSATNCKKAGLITNGLQQSWTHSAVRDDRGALWVSHFTITQFFRNCSASPAVETECDRVHLSTLSPIRCCRSISMVYTCDYSTCANQGIPT